MKSLLFIFQIAFLLLLSWKSNAQEPLRVGHFPNVTHAQALVAHGMTREGKGWFEERVHVPIEWFVYNAGPSAMEALIAGSLDVAYVGPNPALNLFLRSKGTALRVVAGSARGGAGFVVQPNKGLKGATDFKGKKVGTPQFGNTQDVAARAWFQENGLTVTQTGGDLLIIPTEGPEQLTLFQRGELDGVWTVEPWLSRLMSEGKGELLIDERSSVTTVLVVRAATLTARRAEIATFVRAHHELSRWVTEHREEAQKRVVSELSAITGRPFPPELVTASWSRLAFSPTVTTSDFQDFLSRAQRVGFLRDAGDLSNLMEGQL